MDTNSLRGRIKGNLLYLSLDKLQEINNLMEAIIDKSDKKIINMKGIWKGLGFEKIDNLEQEIRIVRNTSEKALEERISRWNI
ncbi:MAG: hypothetical protein ABRQ39_19185 [Candidatus Eremiobacterota bacterium]